MIGYVRLVDHNTGEIQNESYLGLFMDKTRIYQLQKIMTEKPGMKLYCGCSELNDRPVYLTPGGAIRFPEGIPHSSCCVAYLKQMQAAISQTVIGALLGGGAPLQVTFRWGRGCHRRLTYLKALQQPYGKITERITLADFVYLRNVLTFYKCAIAPQKTPRIDAAEFQSSFLSKLLFDFGTHTLEDSSRTKYKITNDCFLSPFSPAGKTYFYYGQVKSINDVYLKNVFLNCALFGHGLSLTVPRALWESCVESIPPENLDTLPLWIAGFVDAKEIKVMMKGSYDSITRTSYGGKFKERTEYSIKCGVLFFTNHYGLICASPEECAGGDTAMRMGYGLEKPVFAIPDRAGDGTITYSCPALIAYSPSGQIFKSY